MGSAETQQKIDADDKAARKAGAAQQATSKAAAAASDEQQAKNKANAAEQQEAAAEAARGAAEATEHDRAKRQAKRARGGVFISADVGGQPHEVRLESQSKAVSKSAPSVQVLIDRSRCITRAEALATLQTIAHALGNADYPPQ